MCLMRASVATYLRVERHQNEHAPEAASYIMVSALMTIGVISIARTFWI